MDRIDRTTGSRLRMGVIALLIAAVAFGAYRSYLLIEGLRVVRGRRLAEAKWHESKRRFCLSILESEQESIGHENQSRVRILEVIEKSGLSPEARAEEVKKLAEFLKPRKRDLLFWDSSIRYHAARRQAYEEAAARPWSNVAPDPGPPS